MEKTYLDFNGKAIYFTHVGDYCWISIKSICEALEADYKTEYQKIKSDFLYDTLEVHYILNTDNQYEKIICMRRMWVLGWMLSVDMPDYMKKGDAQKLLTMVHKNHFYLTIDMVS